ncbi:unnamed protein product [Prorocentrum cordatum]|uniref:Protein C10 n=1 Tax=Prorocentrum cordatum TaxID=2364126 RepID=A0ABN9T3M9_9DINO|nr:unnamed protein product [Polarella glacialis]
MQLTWLACARLERCRLSFEPSALMRQGTPALRMCIQRVDPTCSAESSVSCSPAEAGVGFCEAPPPAAKAAEPESAWPARGRRAAPTAFAKKEANVTTCAEGFRCVSRVRRFGYDHAIEVDASKAAEVEDPRMEDYEWDCPVNGKWMRYSYETGTDPGTCRAENDCLCIASASSSSKSTLVDGQEKIVGNFKVQVGPAKDHEFKDATLTVIPHYKLRRVPNMFDHDDPHSDFGKIFVIPRSFWLNESKETSWKVQRALDELRVWLHNRYVDKVQGKENVQCNDTQFLSKPEQQQASAKIRRFLMMQKECEQLRETMGKLSPRLSDEQFVAEQGKRLGQQALNCFTVEKDSRTCQQLNCYTGPDDTPFQQEVLKLKEKVDSCSPEQDVRLEDAGQQAAAGAKAAEGAAAPGGEAAGAQPPSATPAPAAAPSAPAPGAPPGAASAEVGAPGAAPGPLLGVALAEKVGPPRLCPMSDNILLRASPPTRLRGRFEVRGTCQDVSLERPNVPARAEVTDRTMPGKYTGTVSNWNHPKAGRRNSEGFGFVKVESGEDVGDLFLYADSIKDPKLRSEAKIYGLKNRTRIRFDIEDPRDSADAWSHAFELDAGATVLALKEQMLRGRGQQQDLDSFELRQRGRRVPDTESRSCGTTCSSSSTWVPWRGGQATRQERATPALGISPRVQPRGGGRCWRAAGVPSLRGRGSRRSLRRSAGPPAPAPARRPGPRGCSLQRGQADPRRTRRVAHADPRAPASAAGAPAAPLEGGRRGPRWRHPREGGQGHHHGEQLPERLGLGAVVEEVEVVGERLHYRKLTGAGPEEGWVSLSLSGRELLVRQELSAADAFTLDKALSLQEELMWGFAAPEFQRELRSLIAERASVTKAELAKTKAELFLKIQAPILVKYGFEGSTAGLYHIHLRNRQFRLRQA